jgi:acetyl-CoA/propionyl-CoA carboxylase biotin carboxyl carrier protein
MARRYRISPHGVELELERSAAGLTLRTDDRAVVIENHRVDERYVTVIIDGRTHRYLYAREAGHIHLAYEGQSLCLMATDEEADDATDSAGFTAYIVAPMPGKVLDVVVKVGDRLEAGAPLLLLEAMKMEQTIRTATAAIVAEIHVEDDAMVGPGQTLVTLEPVESDSTDR